MAQARLQATSADPGSSSARRSTSRDLSILVAVSLGAAFVFYLPYALVYRLPSLLYAVRIGGLPAFQQGMESLYGMWDGPLYVTAAATLWDPSPDNPAYWWLKTAPSYYSERFPLYPLAIRLVEPVLGYWNGALFVNVVASTLGTVAIYFLVREFGSPGVSAFWVALATIFWTPRAFLYRYTPMAEPLAVLTLVAAIYFFRRSRFALAGLAGALAVAARPSSPIVVICFGVFVLARLWSATPSERRREARSMLWLALLPLTLGGIYLWHQISYGDWLASMHADTFISPVPELYPSIGYYGFGAETVPYVFTLTLVGIVELARRRSWDLALLCGATYLPIVFVPTDVSRYLIPIMPFALFLAGDRIFSSLPARVGLLLSVPLMYVYAWSAIASPGYQAPFGPLRALFP